MNLPYINVLLTNYDVYSYLTKQDLLFTLKALCINYSENRKIGELQKIKTIALMKLTLVNSEQFTSVNRN